ncbi:MAG: hemolysin family protein [Treponema sp.]|jgi:putative hemolysin|nr:hemolysin family protein [Treponema sp.]
MPELQRADTEDPWPLTATAVFIILALIIASGFCSLFAHALQSSRKSRLQKEAAGDARGGKSRENKKYRRALEAAKDPEPFLAAARFWICVLRILSAVLAGLHAASFLQTPDPAAAVLVIAIATAALSFAVILLGELVPRFIARSAPEQISAAILPLFSLLALPLRPPGFLVRRAGDFLRGAFPLEHVRPAITEDELRLALMEGEKSGIVESKERTMVEGVFYLGDRPVGAFMTHRSEIQWLDAGAPAEDIRAKVLDSRSQRCFPVADGTPDAIIGAAYPGDILLDQASPSPRGLRAVMKKAQFVPESMSALKAFEAFKRGGADFLFVMDEYGGFAGMLSVRVLVEEIVGELSASGPEEEPVTRQEDGAYLADGSLNIDEAAELLSLPGLASARADYHTLAGFVLSLAGELPRTGESFVYQGFRFKVVDMDGNRIDKLLISREEESGAGEGELRK